MQCILDPDLKGQFSHERASLQWIKQANFKFACYANKLILNSAYMLLLSLASALARFWKDKIII